MLAAARARAERERLAGDLHPRRRADARVRAADASTSIVSRFGVMFFEDLVRAFANLRTRRAPTAASLRSSPGASPEENPFMTAAERAAAPLLPNIPPRRAGCAGAVRVSRIRAGSAPSWSGAAGRDIDIRPLDVVCTLPERGSGPLPDAVRPGRPSVAALRMRRLARRSPRRSARVRSLCATATRCASPPPAG